MLRFCDGFDHYTAAADFLAKWSGYSVGGSSPGGTVGGSTTTRYSTGRSFQLTGGFISGNNVPNFTTITKSIDQQPTWTVGFSANFNAINGYNGAGFAILSLYDSAAQGTQLYLNINNSGSLSLYRGTTLLATSSTVLSVGTWYYIEVKATINPTAGSYEVRVNGSSVIGPATGVNTRVTTNNWADAIVINGPVGSFSGPTLLIDDLYMCDGTGTTNNTFLGEIRIQTLLPTGAGNYTQWTPDSGSNYARVNETLVDSDTSYVASSTPGQKDSYPYTQLTGSPSVVGVQTNLWARKDDAATRQIQPLVRIAGTDYLGTTQNMSSGYADHTVPYDTSPASGVAWTATEINGAQFGVNEVA